MVERHYGSLQPGTVARANPFDPFPSVKMRNRQRKFKIMVEAVMGWDHKSPEYAALRAFYFASICDIRPTMLIGNFTQKKSCLVEKR